MTDNHPFRAYNGVTVYFVSNLVYIYISDTERSRSAGFLFFFEGELINIIKKSLSLHTLKLLDV